MKPGDPASRTLAAWKRYVEDGKLDAGALPPEVARAWQRCRAAGVDPHAGRSPVLLTRPELDALLVKRRSLIDVARPFMANLFQFVASSSFVVLLSDERGYLLEVVGAPEIIQEAPEVNFEPGARWSEGEVGNNGVGTALVLDRPFQISGAEHFCRKHHQWTCSGAPIADEDGRTLGILEMSGPVEATHLHTLGMVVAAAEAIRQQLRVQRQNHELMRLNGHLSNLLLTVSDGVIVVDDQGRIRQVNPVAEQLLGQRAQALVGEPLARYLDRPGAVSELLEDGRPFTDVELHLHLGGDTVSCLATAKPIRDAQGQVTDGVLFLNPLQRLHRLINRFSGAHATFTFDDILGSGPALARAVRMGIQAAESESTVLLSGESGTGKEVFAQAIHNRSRRSHGPFIAINCGAIPRELIASELFGYEEGAFTGAHRRGRPGKFELAAGGTLFLDEIGDMPLDEQVSLLRVLQDRAVTRLGGDKVVLVDVRIICATNKDLPLEIARGNFRQDLYYRLNILSIGLPPLRELREDIPMIFRVFQERICRRLGVPVLAVAPAVIARLQQHDWPGNMREFQNAVEKMVSLPNQDHIDASSIPDELLTAAERRQTPSPALAPVSLKEHRAHIRRSLAEQERAQIMDTIARHDGNLSRAAKALGLSRTSLYRKLARSNPD